MWDRLGCVKGCAAMAAPRHMPAIARTPYGADGPTTVAVGVAGRAARRGDHHPTAIGGHEVAYIVVREVVARRFGHGAVLSETADKEPTSCGHLVQCVVDTGSIERRAGPRLIRAGRRGWWLKTNRPPCLFVVGDTG